MKLTLSQIPTFSLIFLRMGIAAIILAPFVKKNLKIQKSDLKLFIIAALLGANIHLSLFFLGLKLTQAINAAILIASAPVITLAAAHIYLKEKLAPRLIIGSIIALFGAILIIGTPILDLNFRSALGNFLLVVSTFAWVTYEIVTKKILKNYQSSTVTFYTMAIGAAVFLPLFFFELYRNPVWFSAVDHVGFFGLTYGIIFSSLIAYSFWGKGLSLLPATEASFFFYLDPVSGIIFSMILLGEKVTPPLIFGSILIVSAVFLVERHRRSHPLHKNS